MKSLREGWAAFTFVYQGTLRSFRQNSANIHITAPLGLRPSAQGALYAFRGKIWNAGG